MQIKQIVTFLLKGLKNIIFFVQRFVLTFNIICAFSLICSALAQIVNPNTFSLLAFFGLAFPFLLFINILFLWYWLLRHKWYFLWSLWSIILNFQNISYTFSNGTNKIVTKNQQTLKVMSYNVQNFDLYNWEKNKDTRNNILEFIDKKSPDVINFQEFYSEDNGVFNNVALLQKMGYKYYHFQTTFRLRDNDNWGLATFSKFPIVQKRYIDFENEKLNGIITTEIIVDSQKIMIINAHLQSVHFSNLDYKFLEQKSKRTFTANIFAILGKLRRAFIQRSYQVALLIPLISTTIPTILTGDFNDTPSSFSYYSIRKSMESAFEQAGSGFGNTYNGIFPSFRIDHIFVNNFITVLNYNRIKNNYSDHYPIIAEITW